MKKNLFFAFLMGVVLFFNSCTGCNGSGESSLVDTITIDNPTLDAAHLTALDKQAMYLTHQDGNYRWYETQIVMKDFLDEETTGEIAELVNVFQYVTDCGNNSYDVKVYKFKHFADGTVANDSTEGFWIEDFPLVDSLVTISYDSAFALVQQVNFPKPHSRHVVLRNPIGAVEVNPQWVFGNVREQLWVDAFTGDIKNSNPVFPEEKGFKMPLGEWP